MVNAGNAKLAAQTGSRAWISVVGAAACVGALGLLVAHSYVRGHPRSIELMAAVALAPLFYQLLFRAMRSATADANA